MTSSSGRRRRWRGLRRPPAALVVTGVLALAATLVAVAIATERIGGENAPYTDPPAPGCVPVSLNRSAVIPGTSLSVSPLPDSLDASSVTQVSLLGAPAGQLSQVTASGSRTGTHHGRLLGYSQGDGASFLPYTPFSAGETVTIHGKVNAQPFAFHFTIARQDPLARQPPGPQPAGNAREAQSFHSRPDLRPPAVTVTTDASGASPGYVFAAPYSGPGQDGPMIFDDSGQLVWFDPLPSGTEATNLQVQQYEGQPVLTWWQGYIPPQGFGKGEEVIANSHYQPIAHVKAGNGRQVDLHDFDLNPNDTALLTVFNTIHCDLSSVGGPVGGAVTDGIFQELDLKTGLVRREWHSLDHVGLEASYSDASGAKVTWPYDYFHINSVIPTADGSTLISARNTWAVYELNTRTGQIVWTLGGKHSSFHMGPGTATAYQHDARELPDGTFTILDNGAVPKVHASRALHVALNMQRKTATRISEYTHSPPLTAGSQANYQTLPNGNVFVGWEVPYFSEYSPSGKLLFDAHLPGANESYRAYRFGWTGIPSNQPAITAGASSAAGPPTIYVSWNGATGVASWRLLAGASPANLVPLQTVPRAGFETAITPSSPARYMAAQALNGAGALIGTSKTIAPEGRT
jgi:hypothetical protein